MRTRFLTTLGAVALALATAGASAKPFSLGDWRFNLAVDSDANLLSLSNHFTRSEWAGGRSLWRLTLAREGQAAVALTGKGQQPTFSRADGRLTIAYDSLKVGETALDIKVKLSVTRSEDGAYHFTAEIENHAPGVCLADFAYPLVAGFRPPKQAVLLSSENGGRRFADFAAVPKLADANCFGVAGLRAGLYFGIHEAKEKSVRQYFDGAKMEAGFVHSLALATNGKWQGAEAVVAPYAGDWKTISRFYRYYRALAGCPPPRELALRFRNDGCDFPQWLRYTYPETRLTLDNADDRMRLLLGIKPLAEVPSALYRKYPQLAGRYLDTDGIDDLFKTQGLVGSAFVQDGKQAFVVTTPKDQAASGTVYFPGCHFKSYEALGKATVQLNGEHVAFTLAPNAVVVLAPIADYPVVEKEGTVSLEVCESNPVVYKGKPYLFQFKRWLKSGQLLDLEDFQSESPELGKGLSMHCAFVEGERMIITAMRGRQGRGGTKEFVLTESTDLVHWTEPRRIFTHPDWGYFFNTSMCKADDGRYVTVTEIYNEGPKNVMTFVESRDLVHWNLDEEKGFCKRKGGGYCGSPCVKYHAGWFYFFYLKEDSVTPGGRIQFRMRVVRSRDLKHWIHGNRVVLGFDERDRQIHPKRKLPADSRAKLASCENLNASDIDMCQYKDEVIISYNWGNQGEIQYVALARVKHCTERQFCESFFEKSAADIPAMRVGETYYGPKDHGYARHQEILRQIRQGGAKVVFIGDSITEFWESRGKNQLACHFSEGDRRMLNLGYSMDRTESVLWRIIKGGELDGYSAKCVVIMIGTNNAGHRSLEKEPPEDTVRAIAEIVRLVREKQPGAVVVLHGIIPRGESAADPCRLRNERVNELAAELADGENVFWCDFGERLVDVTGDTIAFLPDRLHPNGVGYAIWANEVKPYVDYALSDRKAPRPKNRYRGPWPSLPKLAPRAADAEQPLFTAGMMTDTHLTSDPRSGSRSKKVFEFFREQKVDLVFHTGDLANIYCPPAWTNWATMIEATFPEEAKRPPFIYALAGHDRNGAPGTNWEAKCANAYREMLQTFGSKQGIYDSIEFRGHTIVTVPEDGWESSKVEKLIREACKRHPDRPVFVLDHEPGYDTTTDSLRWGRPAARKLYDQYQQVVHIGGHAHNSIRSERNIWQGGHTAIDLGCLQHWDGLEEGFFTQSRQEFAASILEVYPKKLIVRRFDLLTGAEVRPENPWVIPLPFDPKTAPYCQAVRQAREAKPTFTGSISILAQPDNACRIVFPAAQSREGVFEYECELQREDEKGVWRSLARKRPFSDFHAAEKSRSPKVSVRFSRGYLVEGGRYRFVVRAVGMSKLVSEPLVSSVFERAPDAGLKTLFTDPTPRNFLVPTGYSADFPIEADISKIPDGTPIFVAADFRTTRASFSVWLAGRQGYIWEIAPANTETPLRVVLETTKRRGDTKLRLMRMGGGAKFAEVSNVRVMNFEQDLERGAADVVK